MTTHLIEPNCLASELRTRCGLLGAKAKEDDKLGSEGNLLAVDCPDCLRASCEHVHDERNRIVAAADKLRRSVAGVLVCLHVDCHCSFCEIARAALSYDKARGAV